MIIDIALHIEVALHWHFDECGALGVGQTRVMRPQWIDEQHVRRSNNGLMSLLRGGYMQQPIMRHTKLTVRLEYKVEHDVHCVDS